MADVGLANSNYSVSKLDYIARDTNEESAKIDLLIDVHGAGIYILEIKHQYKKFTLTGTEAKKLLRQRRVLAGNIDRQGSIFILLLCSNGVSKNDYTEELIDKIIDPDILLQYS